jgi:hypothetical protein
MYKLISDNTTKHKHDKINVTDILSNLNLSHEQFDALLSYIYTGDIMNEISDTLLKQLLELCGIDNSWEDDIQR